MKTRVAMVLIWAFAAVTIGYGQSTVYLPQVVGGFLSDTAWTSSIVVASGAAPGTGVTTGTITFTKDDGTPMNIAPFLIDTSTLFPAGTGNTISFSLSGGGTRYYLMSVTPAGPFLQGYATVTSDKPVTATELFVEADGATGQGIAIAGVPGMAPAARQAAIAAKTSDTSVGLAYANPNDENALVTLQVLTTSGAAFGSPIDITVEAHTHAALFVNQLFPDLPLNFTGSLQITTSANTPIVATTLLFADSLFGTVPMIPLQ